MSLVTQASLGAIVRIQDATGDDEVEAARESASDYHHAVQLALTLFLNLNVSAIEIRVVPAGDGGSNSLVTQTMTDSEPGDQEPEEPRSPETSQS